MATAGAVSSGVILRHSRKGGRPVVRYRPSFGLNTMQ